MKPGLQKMNIYDISKQSGVSIATVSRAINNSGYVSAKTKAKIMKVIEENNYSPNAFARGMAKASMSSVGILCSDSRDIYQSNCVYHLNNELKKQDYTVMLACTGHLLEEKQKTVKEILAKNPDVLIFIGSHYMEDKNKDNKYLLEAARHIPIIILNGYVEGDNIFGICCDDRQAMYDITAYLIQNDAKKPLFLYRRLNDSGRRKLKGFQDACRDYNVDGSHAYGVQDDLDEIVNNLEDIQDLEHYDSYVCADDEIALAVVKYCQSRSIPIPEQKQVTGYNNSILSRACYPEITTFDNQVEFLAQNAVSLMMNVLNNKDYPSKTTYTGKLVIRQTTRNECKVPQASE